MEIRRAVVSDASVLSLISERVVKGSSNTGFFLESGSVEYYEDLIKEENVYVVVEGTEVCAYMSISDGLPEYLNIAIPEYKAYKYISGLGVLPEYYRKGCATMLMKFAKQWACISDVFIHPMCNLPSIKMHLSCDCKIISEVVMQDNFEVPGEWHLMIFTNTLI